MAHPPRSKPPLRSSSGPPNPCITPSTETLVVVVNLMSWSPAHLHAWCAHEARIASRLREAVLRLTRRELLAEPILSGIDHRLGSASSTSPPAQTIFTLPASPGNRVSTGQSRFSMQTLVGEVAYSPQQATCSKPARRYRASASGE